jgi:N-acyl-D-amino-acid deacylase
LALLDQARADGLEITHDCYAYTASSTAVRQLIPAAALEGSREDYVARIMDPVKKATIVEQMHSAQKRNGYEDYRYAVIAQFRDDPSLNGLNIAEVAMKVRGSDSLDEQVEMILDLQARGGGLAVFHSMSEDDLVLFLQHGSTMIASDGGTREFGADAPHPRSYGNAARFLARYVRDQKRMTLGEGIRRLTSLPAQTFQLENRGVIQVGAIADLVVFDIEAVNDPASYAEPHQYAQGFGDVVVNGVSAIRAGELTGSRSGGAVRLAEPQP